MASHVSEYGSWGNYPQLPYRAAVRPLTVLGVQRALADKPPLLPIGNGRSQGDSGLNEDGGLLDMRRFNHFLSFDQKAGVLRCEAGMLLADILQLIVPYGWFLPVTPGTRYVTIGGALANDVHGKNHHRVGSFGHHVRAFEIVRSTGERIVCRAENTTGLWQATIGGLGLTGVVTWVELQLRPITSSYIDEEICSLKNIDEFFQQVQDLDTKYEYTVGWIDCLARGRRLGRGWLLVGNHATAERGERAALEVGRLYPRLTVPWLAAGWMINPLSIRMFNSVWFHKARWRGAERRVHYNPFFYPLDAVEYWNNLYGRRGFFQYQCVIPLVGAPEVMRELLARIAKSQSASFLSTLKFFGDKPPAGMLSFPRAGVALAVDFANRGSRTLKLFDELDEVVAAAGGALYPAKDSRMSPEMFRASFLRLAEFKKHIDPALSSSFWRRVSG